MERTWAQSIAFTKRVESSAMASVRTPLKFLWAGAIIQVKIRGFRIELGEIETVLKKNSPGVRDASGPPCLRERFQHARANKNGLSLSAFFTNGASNARSCARVQNSFSPITCRPLSFFGKALPLHTPERPKSRDRHKRFRLRPKE